MNIIETHQLSKRFADNLAVDKVTMHVRSAEIYGFLGLNGAGKTTTIRMLLGMIKPNNGFVTLFGQKVKQASDIWNDVGYLVENSHSYPDLTVKENLEVMYRLRGLHNWNSIDQVIDQLHLTAFRDRKVKHLSTGNNQRLGLAKAFLHRPKLLILDEPTNGLDPAGIIEIRELTEELARNMGTTIFLSSHILSEISKLATRIGIIDQGRLVKEINSNELDNQIFKKLKLDTTDNTKALDILNKQGYSFSANSDGTIVSSDREVITQPESIATFLVNKNLPPKLLQVVEEDLESFFLRTIGRQVTKL